MATNLEPLQLIHFNGLPDDYIPEPWPFSDVVREDDGEPINQDIVEAYFYVETTGGRPLLKLEMDDEKIKFDPVEKRLTITVTNGDLDFASEEPTSARYELVIVLEDKRVIYLDHGPATVERSL